MTFSREPAEAKSFEEAWARGEAADLASLRRATETLPVEALPAFLRGPGDTVLCVAPDARDADEVAALLRGLYWTEGLSDDTLARAHLGSNVWIVARCTQTAQILASGRAVTDSARFGWIMDMIVREDRRGQGLGSAVLTLLLDHPRARHVRTLGLRTRDAASLYRKFGFARNEGRFPQMTRTTVSAGED